MVTLRIVKGTEEAPAKRPIPETYSNTLCLTRVEEDVWTSLAALSMPYGAGFRIGVPAGTECLRELWAPSSLNCSAEEYADAFERFVEAGIIRLVGRSAHGLNTWEFACDPAEYRGGVTVVARQEEPTAQSTIEAVLQSVARYHKLKVVTLCGCLSTPHIEEARAYAAFLIHLHTNMPMDEIASIFSGKTADEMARAIEPLERYKSCANLHNNRYWYMWMQADYLRRKVEALPCNKGALEAAVCDFVQEMMYRAAKGTITEVKEIMKLACFRFAVSPLAFTVRAEEDASDRYGVVADTISYCACNALGRTAEEATSVIFCLPAGYAYKVDCGCKETASLMRARSLLADS